MNKPKTADVRSGGKRIVAFVDYEHWYYSMQNLYRQKPNVVEWFDLLASHGRVVDCIFFADFSQNGIRDELGKIRTITNKIIETRNPNPKFKKDYTDFIMLDNIYQRALQDDDIDLFVIFSGDGHFSSVTSFLKNYCSKEVGIFGVSGATNRLLKDSADWHVELPTEQSDRHRICESIFAAARRVEDMQLGYVSEATVVSTAAGGGAWPRHEVRDALSSLVDMGLITLEEHRFSLFNKTTALRVEWDAVKAAGYLNAEESPDIKKQPTRTNPKQHTKRRKTE